MQGNCLTPILSGFRSHPGVPRAYTWLWTRDGAQGTISSTGDQTQESRMQGWCPTQCTISPVPKANFFNRMWRYSKLGNQKYLWTHFCNSILATSLIEFPGTCFWIWNHSYFKYSCYLKTEKRKEPIGENLKPEMISVPRDRCLLTFWNTLL